MAQACAEEDAIEEQTEQTLKRGWRFWVMFPGLGLTAALTALDATVLSTTLSTIVDSLQSDSLFIWLLNAYYLTMTVVQPMYGQAADLFGRKPVMIAAVITFILGSGICAGASNTAMMISGRVVQGIGAGGISVLPSMIICDLIPQRECQKYIGLLYAAFAIGTDLGPIIGGALVDRMGWRWVFWINLPIAGFALLLIAVFLNVQHARAGTITQQFLQFDFAGNAILIASVTSILLALSSAGSTNTWMSWRILVPLLVGFLGLALFVCFEGSHWCKQPTMPLRLFTNRTSFIGYLVTFLHGLLLYWVIYFLPVYFQAVLQASPQQSGVNILASMVPLVPSGILGGALISRNGHYKINQLVGFALISTGIGCFTLLDQNSTKTQWVVFQIIYAAGTGLLMTAALPAIQAPLSEADVGSATATWGFIQSLGYIWGSSIPASIFSTRFDHLLPQIQDLSIKQQLSDGGAYEHASKAFVSSLTAEVRVQVIAVYVESLKLVWQICIAFALLSFLAALFIKEVKLREVLVTKFGYKDGTDPSRCESEEQIPGEKEKMTVCSSRRLNLLPSSWR